ncbi:GDSL-type esterase/lipase family protein [Nocardia thailandica]|uniref:GDSL-type esterase/lipase family protein n=1 Tax=Nocardia thailandica TaxID=257275 RepID=A0ABW6PG14_9NOCA
MTRDLRVCFLGDSLVAGVGDRSGLGWPGRLTARSYAAGQPLTPYNLGVRGATSPQIRARWRAECEPRLPSGTDARVALSCGVNDTHVLDGARRVPLAVSVETVTALLAEFAEAGLPALVVGPPAVRDPAHNEAIAELDAAFAAVCATAGVEYVPVYAALGASAAWMAEVAAIDGAHPGAAGYDELAALIAPRWDRFVTA